VALKKKKVSKAKKVKKSVSKKKVVKSSKKKITKKISKKTTKLKRKPAKKSPAKGKIVARQAKGKEKIIGSITHYFPHVRAAVIKLKAPLSVGDTIKIKGHTTDFTQTISSLQIDRVPVVSAKVGQEIGLLVNSRVRQHDEVFKI